MAMINVTVRQLEYFLAVVDAGSASRAAEVCHISQAGLSAALIQLETTLGIQLFVRQQSKRLVLTADGRRLVNIVRAAISQVSDVETLAAALSGDIKGEIRLGCFHTLSPIAIPRAATFLAESYPEVRLQTYEGGPAQLELGIQEGRLDGALVYAEHLEGDWELNRISSQTLVASMHPAHPLAERELVPLSALAGHPLVLLDLPPLGERIVRLLATEGITDEPAFRSTNMETVRALVARGMGYSLGSLRALSGKSHEGLPITTRPVLGEPPRTLVMATPHGRPVSRKLAALIAYFREELLNL